MIESTFPGKLLETKIRRDVQVGEAAIFGQPVFDVAPSSRASEDYLNLTKELLTNLSMQNHEESRLHLV